MLIFTCELETPLSTAAKSSTCTNHRKRWDLNSKALHSKREASQPAITCSKLTIETVEQGVKYVQS